MKGKAAAAKRKIGGDDWPQVKANLNREIGDRTPIETILEKVETLRQGPNESFHDCKSRVLKLRSDVESFDGRISVTMDKSLRLHCIGGLRNRQLVQLAQGHRELPLLDLLNYLEEQHAECKEIA